MVSNLQLRTIVTERSQRSFPLQRAGLSMLIVNLLKTH